MAVEFQVQHEQKTNCWKLPRKHGIEADDSMRKTTF